MRFTHIIVTKGRPGPLAAALTSVTAVMPPDGEIIVVDGDPDRSAEPVAARFTGARDCARMRYLPSAPGVPVQRNVGIDAATGEVVVFTDDDCTLEPGFYVALEQAYADEAVVGASGYVLSPPSRRIGSDDYSRLRRLLLGGGREGTMTRFGFRRPIVDVGTARDVEFMLGPLMTARTSVARSVRFDESLVGYALGEDEDFSYRLSCCGRVRYEPRAAVTHHALGFRSAQPRERDRRTVVNRSYLFRKNFNTSLRARAGFAGLMMMMLVHRAVNREWEGLRGLIDGMRAVRRGEQPG